MIRAVFIRNGFFPAVSSSKSEFVIIASFIAADHLTNETDRFSKIIEHIVNIKGNAFIDGARCTFGVSTVYEEVSNANKGYKGAEKSFTYARI